MKRGKLAAFVLLAILAAPAAYAAPKGAMVLKPHIECASFSPDAKSLVIMGYDNTLSVWDVDSGKRRFDIPMTPSPLFSMAFTDDSRCVIATGASGKLGMWDVESGSEVKSWQDDMFRDVSAIACKGNLVALGKEDGSVVLWNHNRGAVEGVLEEHAKAVCYVGFHPSGSVLASCGKDKRVVVWDVQTQRPLVRQQEDYAIWAAAFSPTTQQVAYGAGMFQAVAVLSLVGREPKKELPRGDSTYVLVYSPDGKQLVTAGAGGCLRIWDPESGTLRKALNGHNDAVLAAAFTPKGQLVSLDCMGNLQKW